MKLKIFIPAVAVCLFLTGCNLQNHTKSPEFISIQKPQIPELNQELIVEAACGQCQFDLPGKGCNLAIRIDDQVYYVDGSTIDAHGDAHAKDGLCNSVQKARVQGTIANNRFISINFNLVK
jgi:hypothetical protein